MFLNVAMFAMALAHVSNGHVTRHEFLQQDSHHEVATQVHADAVPPVSTTMKAVINLTIQYFIVYSALAVLKTYNEFRPGGADNLYKIVEAASITVNYAPMLSVLFIGVRMRALQLSQGKPDEHNLPQWWVKDAMLTCAWTVLIQTIMVLVVPFCFEQKKGEPMVSEDGTPNVPAGDSMLAKGLTAVRYLAMLGTYGGFTAVVVGAFMMDPPKELWPDGVPPVSPAVGSTMNLSAQYFFVYLGIAVCHTYQDFQGKTPFLTKLEGIFRMAVNTVNFAPMLCILFIGARMRALQIDPVNGNPQRWAQMCFYACAYSVLVQLALVFVIPLLLGGEVKREKGAADGDVTFVLDEKQKTTLSVLTGVRFLLMLALYGGFTAVIVSVHTIEDKTGNVPPLSPAMLCVMNLTVQYFLVYLLFWVFLTTKQFVESMKETMTACMEVVTIAQKTVKFAPMLSVLFIGLRLRALQITDQKGSPQGWAQQGMFLATYAVMLQLLLIFCMGALKGPPKTDEEGNPVAEGAGAMAMALSGFRYLALLCVYGGAITCVYALFTITPETATGQGSLIHPALDVPPPPAADGSTAAGAF